MSETLHTLAVELKDIRSITPYDRNPRINDNAVDAVAASLKEFGFRQPIVVDTDVLTRNRTFNTYVVLYQSQDKVSFLGI